VCHDHDVSLHMALVGAVCPLPYIRYVLDILDIMLTWRCTKGVTSRNGKCHNIKENELGESFTILSLLLNESYCCSPTLEDGLKYFEYFV
jgi:hypothetical protein